MKKILFIIGLIICSNVLLAAASDFIIRSREDGGNVIISPKNAGGTAIDLITADPDAANMTLHKPVVMSTNNSSMSWSAGYGGLSATSGLRFQLDSDSDSAGEEFGIYKDSATLGGGTKLFHVDETGEGYFSGNVGIGTSSPGSALEINAAGSPQLKVKGSSSAVLSINSLGGTYSMFQFENNSVTKWQLYNDGTDSDKIKFESATGTRMVIDQSGNTELKVRTDSNCGIGNVCSGATTRTVDVKSANVTNSPTIVVHWTRVGETVSFCGGTTDAAGVDVSGAGQVRVGFDLDTLNNAFEPSANYSSYHEIRGTCALASPVSTLATAGNLRVGSPPSKFLECNFDYVTGARSSVPLTFCGTFVR